MGRAAKATPHPKFAIRSTFVRRTIVGQIAANPVSAQRCAPTKQLHKYAALLSSTYRVKRRRAPNSLDFNAARRTPALACRLLLLLAVNEDCGSPDCFSHCWLKLRDRLKPPSRKLGAVGAMPDGSHIPVSDRTRSENRMVNDATLHRAQTKYFRKRFGDQNRSSGIRTRSHLSASPTVIAHLSAEQGES